jgi:predicted phage-related endonuclease
MIERWPITDRAAWIQWRLLDVTASDVPALFGADPYKTRLGVWAEKRGLVPPIADNAWR